MKYSQQLIPQGGTKIDEALNLDTLK